MISGEGWIVMATLMSPVEGLEDHSIRPQRDSNLKPSDQTQLYVYVFSD